MTAAIRIVRVRCAAGCIRVALFAQAVKYRARGVDLKAVVGCDMMRDLMQMTAVQMNQPAADRAFQMKMRVTSTGFRLFTGILPAGTAAVVERIPPDKAVLLEFFELPVDCCCTHWCAVFGQRMQKLCCRDVPFRMCFEIFENQRFLFCLITVFFFFFVSPRCRL